ncbi:MAG: phosphatase PAP2-related protein [Bacteroidota bacterium]
MLELNHKEIKNRWKEAYANEFFKRRLLVGLLVWIAILIAFPFFFNYIEARNGMVLNDFIINKLPAYDVSVPTFLIIWSMFLLLLYRAIYDPQLLLLFLWGFIFLSLSRFLSIYLLPLNPPNQLIALRDPITNIFYGKEHGFITKDLFYSGHTSTQFLMFLCFKKKMDKQLALVSTMAVGMFVLIQHVHYSIDVIASPFLTYLIFLISKRVVKY